jgi:hypothetical protein
MRPVDEFTTKRPPWCRECRATPVPAGATTKAGAKIMETRRRRAEAEARGLRYCSRCGQDRPPWEQKHRWCPECRRPAGAKTAAGAKILETKRRLAEAEARGLRYCSRCEQEKPPWKQKHRWCGECRRDYNRQWLKENPERVAASRAAEKKRRKERGAYSKPDPVKARARSLLNRAVRRGDVIRPSACSRCGADGPVEGHHPDYDRPLEVVWVCVSCHKALDEVSP